MNEDNFWDEIEKEEDIHEQNKLVMERFENVFSDDMNKIFDEKIISDGYMHPLQFSQRFRDEIPKWNRKRKLLHLTDSIYFGRDYEIKKEKVCVYRILDIEVEPGKFREWRGHDYLDFYEGFDAERLLPLVEDFNIELLMLETEERGFLIKNLRGNNNDSLIPKKLKSLDNELDMIRVGRIPIFRISKETARSFIRGPSYNFCKKTYVHETIPYSKNPLDEFDILEKHGLHRLFGLNLKGNNVYTLLVDNYWRDNYTLMDIDTSLDNVFRNGMED